MNKIETNDFFFSRGNRKKLERVRGFSIGTGSTVGNREPISIERLKRLTTVSLPKNSFLRRQTGIRETASFKRSITQINFCSVRSIDKRGIFPPPPLFGLGPDVRSGYILSRENISAYIFLRRKHGNRVSHGWIESMPTPQVLDL